MTSIMRKVFMMKNKSKVTSYIAVLISLCLILSLTVTAYAEKTNRKPKAGNPADHTFPALGASDERKVEVAWNRFYDHAGMGNILAQLHMPGH